MRVRDGGAWREIDSGRVYVGGAWRRLVEARAYVSGAWKTVATFTPPLSVSVSPSSPSGSIIGAGTCETINVTATPSGGIAPYTYAWGRTSGVGAAFRPTSANTTFFAALTSGQSATGDFQIIVTDSVGNTASAAVTAFFNSLDSGGA